MAKQIHGRKVTMSRAPMTNPSTVTVRVIDDAHPLADIIEEDTVYMSPLGNFRDAGDNDGDGRTFADAQDSTLAITTVDDVVASIVERTGEDQLRPGAAYWGDHYNVASCKDVKKKTGLQAKNLSLANGEYEKSLPGMLEGSTKMFQEAVGWVHRLFLTGDIYLSLVWALAEDLKVMFPEWKPAGFSANKDLILILAEIYEVPLGGLCWHAYEVIFDYLIPVLQGISLTPAKIGKLAKAMDNASMNGNAAKDVAAAAGVVSDCRKLSKEGVKPSDLADPEVFLKLAAELASLISKGQVNFNKKEHQSLIMEYITWIEAYDPQGQLQSKSVVLTQLSEWTATVAIAAMGEVPEIDLDLF